jgi:transposase
MRLLYINKDSELALFCPWALEVPADLREDAMRDAIKAIVAYAAKEAENKNGFKFKFRSKRDEQNLVVRARHWGRKSGAYSQIWGSGVLRTSSPRHPLPAKLHGDSRLVKDKMNRYFLCMPVPMDTKQSAPPDKIVALDPGVRTFQTCYDQDGVVTEIGPGDRKRLFMLAVHSSRLHAKIHGIDKEEEDDEEKERERIAAKKKKKKEERERKAEERRMTEERGERKKRRKRRSKRRRTERRRLKNKRSAKKNKMRKAMLRINNRIRNLTDDVHKKACKWLLENHKTILIPAFQSSAMVKKEKRKLTSKSARSMMHWSHFRFRQRLLFKSQEYPGTRVLVVKEDYTSKSCGRCGAIKDNLGGSKVFHCPRCHFQCGRDINGARNILLKWLTETQPQLSQGEEGVWDLTPSAMITVADAEAAFASKEPL